MMLSPLKFKVLAGALAGSLLLSGGLGIGWAITASRLNSAKEVIQSLNRGWDGLVTSVRLASGNDKVTRETAPQQTQAMGQSLATLHEALTKSNDAVDALARDAEQARVRAEAEGRKRAAAIKKAESLAAQLEQQALTPVAPEEVEAEIRRTQDELYEAGL